MIVCYCQDNSGIVNNIRVIIALFLAFHPCHPLCDLSHFLSHLMDRERKREREKWRKDREESERVLTPAIERSLTLFSLTYSLSAPLLSRLSLNSLSLSITEGAANNVLWETDDIPIFPVYSWAAN